MSQLWEPKEAKRMRLALESQEEAASIIKAGNISTREKVRTGVKDGVTGIIKITAYGWVAVIGEVFNEKTGIFSTTNILQDDVRIDYTQTEKHDSSEFQVYFTNGTSEKFDVSGLILKMQNANLNEVEGSGDCLFNQPAQWESLKYSVKTETDFIDFSSDELQQKIPTRKLVLAEIAGGTHVTMGINWGADIAISFAGEKTEPADTFSGDIHLGDEPVPKNLTEFAKLLDRSHMKLADVNGGKGVPKIFTLVPIKSLLMLRDLDNLQQNSTPDLTPIMKEYSTQRDGFEDKENYAETLGSNSVGEMLQIM